MRICFASHNKNKIKELNELLSDHHQIVGLSDLGIHEEIPETGNTFEENSRIKATYVLERFNIPVFADDSGLLVEALDGAPGVYSARYAGPEKDDKKNLQLLLKNLGNSENRKASFKTVITYLSERGEEAQFDGTIKGTIINEERGKFGFGYDPIFVPDGYDETFAELPSNIKNKISHRGVAVQKLIHFLSTVNE